MVDRAQVQAFLLGYLSGQLGLLIVPDTLVRTWSHPAGTHTTNDKAACESKRMGGGWGGCVSEGGHNISSGGGFECGVCLTFLAVVLIIVQHEAAAALTTVTPEGIDALVLAAAIFFGTLVDICEIIEKKQRTDEFEPAAGCRFKRGLCERLRSALV